MVIYKTRWFARWARKEGLSDKALRLAVEEMAQGLFEADLGGDLFKKRIARPGEGKRGGYRTLVATNRASRWIFVYGFAKNVRSNIDSDEEVALKKLAATLLKLTPAALIKARNLGSERPCVKDHRRS
jgi:hypothetical protein